MLVYSDHKLEQFQVLGAVVRVHWDHQQQQIEHMDGQISQQWVCMEAVVPTDADRGTFISIVNAAGGDGAALADQWFNNLYK